MKTLRLLATQNLGFLLAILQQKRPAPKLLARFSERGSEWHWAIQALATTSDIEELRITSYNVCYTKLLRARRSASKRASRSAWKTAGAGGGQAAGMLVIMKYALMRVRLEKLVDERTEELRITSYNVCYTKLLR